jgi:hypothetical protein
MSRRDKPSLEDLQRDLLYRTRELHRALIAPEGSIEAPPPNAPKDGAVAVNKGLQKLRRAAYHARSANAAASAPVSRELMRIAESIERNGLDVQMADLERIRRCRCSHRGGDRRAGGAAAGGGREAI